MYIICVIIIIIIICLRRIWTLKKKCLFALALPSHTHTHVTMLTFEFWELIQKFFCLQAELGLQINTFSCPRFFLMLGSRPLSQSAPQKRELFPTPRIWQVSSIFVGLFQAFRFTVAERGRKNKTDRCALPSERLEQAIFLYIHTYIKLFFISNFRTAKNRLVSPRNK